MPSSFISLILPIRNESAFIERVLQAIQGQDYPTAQMEVLIADGMSTDNTREIIQSYAAQHQELHIYILDNPGQIVPTGMNIALRQAKGEIIIRVDGHTVIAPDYVRQCVQTLSRTHADNVGGKMTAVGGNSFGRAVACATSTPFGVGGARFHYSNQEEWVDTVYMGAWPQGVFEQIGLFDEELVRDQDDEFNYRLREGDGKILLCPQIKSKYHVRSHPKALWWQYYQYGFYKVRVLQKHPRQMSIRQFVPPLFVAALVSTLVGGLFSLWGWILLGVILLTYLSANMTATLITASKYGQQHLLDLSLAYAILHLSYGFGFLSGLVHFWNRWGDKTGRAPNWDDNLG